MEEVPEDDNIACSIPNNSDRITMVGVGKDGQREAYQIKRRNPWMGKLLWWKSKFIVTKEE